MKEGGNFIETLRIVKNISDYNGKTMNVEVKLELRSLITSPVLRMEEVHM